MWFCGRKNRLAWLNCYFFLSFSFFVFIGREREREPEALVGDICIDHKSDP
jgi:hypothetical protein